MKPALVLGIETSCDETAAAVVCQDGAVKSNIVASQVDLHERFGGVVPEIASRKHLEAMVPVLSECFKVAGAEPSDIDAVAVTVGPGLVGALLVGIATAKALGLSWEKPVVGVNHLVGHVYANFLEGSGRIGQSSADVAEIEFPAVCLVASGGHTDLVSFPGHGVFSVLGRTRDDAAGEVLDKVARAAGLGYPGGPLVEVCAREGDPGAVAFPRAYLEPGSLDFSFSGLKTALLLCLKSREKRGIPLADVMASFQEAVMEVLAEKAARAAAETRARCLLLAGGVASNQRLRDLLRSRSPVPVFAPPPMYCTDNAAMIARAGAERLRLVGPGGWEAIDGVPDLEVRSWA